jgi:chemotaxis protein histidine kinase CheA
MKQTDLTGYKNIYLQTAKEYLNNIKSGYLKLSANSQDKEAISAIHVSSHSLGGQSQIMGFTDIAKLSADIEKASANILDKVNSIDNEFMSLLKKSIDELDLEFSRIEKAQ